jgi:hypothetical protein
VVEWERLCLGWGIHGQLMGSKAVALHVTVYLLDSLPDTTAISYLMLLSLFKPLFPETALSDVPNTSSFEFNADPMFLQKLTTNDSFFTKLG